VRSSPRCSDINLPHRLEQFGKHPKVHQQMMLIGLKEERSQVLRIREAADHAGLSLLFAQLSQDMPSRIMI